MLAHWNIDLQSFIPWVAFISGLAGSLHCVGMCGGLVTASCKDKSQVALYQVGRLFSYTILGLIGGSLGSIINFRTAHPLLNLLPSIVIGMMFIIWGIKSIRNTHSMHSASVFLSKIYQSTWRKFIGNNTSKNKPLLIGSLSILLPCGLLYSIVLGTMATQSTMNATIGMIFFWLGTLPAMLIAPNIINKILEPFKIKQPKLFAVCLVVIGLVTIGVRAKAQFNHTDSSHNKTEQSCH